ncbi:hypothetical protein H5410_052613, partial [Solanum commersonii]
MERYGWESFECQREAKYMGDEFVNEVRLQSQFPDINRVVHKLGLRFIFDNPGDCNLTLVREFYANWLTEMKYKIVFVREKDVKFYARILNELLGTPNCVPDEWERSKDTRRHNTLYFANFNQVAKGFCYGGLITHFLRAEGIEEEALDMTVAYHSNLMGKLVDVTCTKTLDTYHGHVLSAQERQARDDSVMARMFGMKELQMRIGGRPVTDEEMETMAKRYPLTESAAFLCQTGPAFLEPLDDDETTADEAIDDGRIMLWMR